MAGKDVYLVLSPPHGGCRDRRRVTVDGKHEKTVHVTSQRLYHLLSRPQTGARTTCVLHFSPGVAGYAFTFG